MTHALVSKKSATAASLALFFVGLVIVTYLREWWPGIMLVVGVPLALRQYLMGRTYDMGISLFVFLGAFITVQFEFSWDIVLPVLFTIGAIYIFFREYLESSTSSEDEKEENINHEIEEEKK